MIAQRFRSIGWVAGCATAALCCYLASQSVASERAALARVDREITSTTHDIKRLTTEISARGRMGQIERWNVEVLALQAPAPGQFVANEVQLASLAGGKPLPLDPAIVASKGAVQTVAYQGPAAAQAAPPQSGPEQPMLRQATFVRAKPIALEAAAATGVIKASLTRTRPFELDLDGAAPVAAKPKADIAAEKPAVAPAKKPVVGDARPKAKSALTTASLLPTDLGSLIAAEKKGPKPARTSADR